MDKVYEFIHIIFLTLCCSKYISKICCKVYTLKGAEHIYHMSALNATITLTASLQVDLLLFP